ncbi:DUF418 domain-containing protein [Sphingomonas sp. PL-96]|uniref:DUF418 domain-containing protein n=1 Tax=Sphingomonas sp. PL-96 TaxID=2887201 RepID=UPI001E545E50|nr:DUF418 domain-containing protein [Sphingomonas sp. PL-96]MCC2975391.1 DUF418 domain-containing protein [Sphingomonas sp. PL-96]
MATTQADRIGTLDTVRGVAVMGILLMNIVAFAMPDAAYINPAAYGGYRGADLAVFLVNFVLFDGKMRGLFSLLFGASMLLVIERAEAKGESPARVHFSRMAWLFVFGIAHLLLLWWGDILNQYAVIGAIAYSCRHADEKTLVTRGIVLVATAWLLLAFMPLGVAAMQAGIHDPDPAKAAASAESLRTFVDAMGVPSAAHIQSEFALHRGSWAGLIAHRWSELSTSLSSTLFVGAETLGYMLFGMAALRSGMLTGGWSRARLRRWLLVCFGIGIPGYALLAAWLVSRNFGLVTVAASMAIAPPLRVLMILGWACLILLLARPGGALTERIAAAGRMAFTNYLATSIVMTTLFYGYGLGWYGTFSRAALYPVVFAMWAAMLLWSQAWLSRFRYGPFEWLWRTLARLEFQPMRGAALPAR